MSVSKDRWLKREAFTALIEKGEFQGFITTEDIFTVLSINRDASGKAVFCHG